MSRTDRTHTTSASKLRCVQSFYSIRLDVLLVCVDTVKRCTRTRMSPMCPEAQRKYLLLRRTNVGTDDIFRSFGRSCEYGFPGFCVPQCYSYLKSMGKGEQQAKAKQSPLLRD